MANLDHSERVHREDMVMFINACFACSGQGEFYSDRSGQWLSIEFLHAYILRGYRRLYARTLAAGINHFNRTRIILNLLADPVGRSEEEGRLIRGALRELPVQRVYRLFDEIRRRRINNRRTRAIIKEYVTGRDDPVFDALKYRSNLRQVYRHAHLAAPGEIGDFLFLGRRKPVYKTPLFESFRRARYDTNAIYDLPYSVAEGLAAAKGVDRGEFLERIQDRMSAGEKLRNQSAARRENVEIKFDPGRAGLTRLALYALSLKAEARDRLRGEVLAGMARAARRTIRRAPFRLPRTASVLDRSFSASGSVEKKRRPLAVAFAADRLLRVASREYRAFWTGGGGEDRPGFIPEARGQTDLATPLMDALEWEPELVLIISDGFENDPPGAAEEIARVYRDRLRGRATLVHLNPVYDELNYNPRTLGPSIPTVGLRDAEDLATMLGFARFAEGSAPLEELERYLAGRARELLNGHKTDGEIEA